MVQPSVHISEGNESGSFENLVSGGWSRGSVLEEYLDSLCGLKDSPRSHMTIFSWPRASSLLEVFHKRRLAHAITGISGNNLHCHISSVLMITGQPYS